MVHHLVHQMKKRVSVQAWLAFAPTNKTPTDPTLPLLPLPIQRPLASFESSPLKREPIRSKTCEKEDTNKIFIYTCIHIYINIYTCILMEYMYVFSHTKLNEQYDLNWLLVVPLSFTLRSYTVLIDIYTS